MIGGERECLPPLPAAKLEKPCQSPGEVTSSRGDLLEICDEFEEDFDAESILDEEVEEGIDSIMGNLMTEGKTDCELSRGGGGYCYGFPVGMGFDFDFGCGMMMRRESRAMRNADDGERWSSLSVNVVDITRGITGAQNKKTKKKKKRVDLAGNSGEEAAPPCPSAGLRLNLNYDDVLSAWSDKGSPFSGDAPAAVAAGNDVQVCNFVSQK